MTGHFKPQVSILILVTFLIICAFVRLSYQQYQFVDYDSKFVKHDTLSTIQTFWHDGNINCEMDSSVLIGLYKKLLDRSCAEEDQFVVLLTHNVRKQLIHSMFTQLKNSLKQKSLKYNKIFQQNLQQLQEIDKRAVKSIWAMAIKQVDHEEVINEIVRLKDEELQIDAFQNLINNSLLDKAKTDTIIPILTFHITTLFKNKTTCLSLETSLDRLYCHLPQQLRLLYEGLKQPYILTNLVSLPKGKQVICTLVAVHDKGLVAFGIQLGGSVMYIYAGENNRISFENVSDITSNQLWQVIWPDNSYGRDAPGYILFQNENTKKLLCLDEQKMIQLSAVENMLNPACYWLVSYATDAERRQEC